MRMRSLSRGKGAERRGLVAREAERLLHEDVPTRAKSGFGHLEMGGGVGGYDDRRNRGIVENDLQVRDCRNTRIERRHLASDAIVVITDIAEIGFRDGRVVPNMVLTPTTRPDDGNPRLLVNDSRAPRLIRAA